MKKTSRYLLLAFGIVVFFILAPLLILYVTGTRLNLGEGPTSGTGILDIKSSPSGSSVSLEKENKGTTPTIVRFLNQGEYLIKLTKDGYYDWSKRLPIESGQVTYAQEGVDTIQLIKKAPPTVISPSGVTSFALVDDTVWFARGNGIVHAPINNPTQQFTIPLTFTPRNVQVLRDGYHLFLTGDTAHAVIDTQSGAAYQLNFSFDPNDATVVNNILLVNIGEIFRSYNLTTKTETILRSDILGFTMLDSTAYFADRTGTISSAIWNGSNFSDIQPLVSNQSLPEGRTELIITDRKELFLQDAAKNLYRVNEKLELIANQVDSVNLDQVTNELTYRTSSEMWFYNFLINKPQLLTRSTTPTHDLLIRSNIGYGFVASDSGLEAIEIDVRDKQNRYQLLKDSTVYQLAISKDEKTVLALQDGMLVMISIRD